MLKVYILGKTIYDQVKKSAVYWKSFRIFFIFFKRHYWTHNQIVFLQDFLYKFSSLTGIPNFSFALFEKQSGKRTDRKANTSGIFEEILSHINNNEV